MYMSRLQQTRYKGSLLFTVHYWWQLTPHMVNIKPRSLLDVPKEQYHKMRAHDQSLEKKSYVTNHTDNACAILQ
jgi:hypothetical protein